MAFAKSVFKVAGVCAVFLFLAAGFYDLYNFSFNMIEYGDLLSVCCGFLCMICLSAIVIFISLLIISFAKMKWLGEDDEDDKDNS